MSDELYAKIGRMQCENDALKANYTRLLNVFAETLRASRPTPDADEPGKCNPLRILINLTDETYMWSAVETRPAMPATINGLPVVVVAPNPPPDEPPTEDFTPAPNGDGHGVNRLKELIRPNPV